MEIGGAIQFPLPKIPIARPHLTAKTKERFMQSLFARERNIFFLR
jgi:hypothetical protein